MDCGFSPFRIWILLAESTKALASVSFLVPLKSKAQICTFAATDCSVEFFSDISARICCCLMNRFLATWILNFLQCCLTCFSMRFYVQIYGSILHSATLFSVQVPWCERSPSSIEFLFFLDCDSLDVCPFFWLYFCKLNILSARLIWWLYTWGLFCWDQSLGFSGQIAGWNWRALVVVASGENSVVAVAAG